MGLLAGFGCGVFGGALAELLGWFRLRQQAPPDFVKSPFYWLVTALMVLAGGGLVVIYVTSGFEIKPVLAVNIGASAPLLIASLAARLPSSIDPAKID